MVSSLKNAVKFCLRKLDPVTLSYLQSAHATYHEVILLRRFIKYLNLQHPEICISLLDVGARDGLSGAPMFRPLAQVKHKIFHGIEPDNEEADRLRESGEYDHIFTDGVAWYNGEAVLHIPSANPGAGSIRELDPYCKQLTGVADCDWRDLSIRVRKLSDILPKGATYDFIKTDVEGCDYDVLASAEPVLLEKALCVVCETQRIPVFKDQKVTADLHAFLKEKGFLLCQYSMHGNAYAQDAVYVRDPQSIQVFETLLKYVLLGLCLSMRDLSFRALKMYELNHGKQETLNAVYQILDRKRNE